MRFNGRIHSLLFVLGLGAAAAPCGAGEMLWSVGDPAVATFVPQSVLSTTPVDELPVSATSLKALKAAIAYSLEVHGGEDVCEGGRGALATIAPARDLAELVRESPLAILADVSDKEAGWDGDGYGVVTAVALQSVRPLASTEASIPPAFTLLFAGGRLKVRRVSLCDPGTASADFDVGRRFLVLADSSEETIGRLDPIAWFPVEGSVVKMEGTYWVKDSVDQDLGLLESELRSQGAAGDRK